MTVPYYPTVNMEQNPTDRIWMTAEFGSSYREVLTICQGDVLEDGEVEVIFFGPPGIGYTEVLTALELSIAALLQKVDPAGKLTLTGRSAPFEYSRGTALKNYAVSVYVDYQYYM
jgi:hypothetical protein